VVNKLLQKSKSLATTVAVRSQVGRSLWAEKTEKPKTRNVQKNRILAGSWEPRHIALVSVGISIFHCGIDSFEDLCEGCEHHLAYSIHSLFRTSLQFI
jgi:hypothetical protein